MNEKSKTKSQSKNTKKDMYTAVLISQIMGVIILAITFSLTVKNNESSYNYLKGILSEEKFTLGDIVSTVKEYLSADNSWAVFGDNVSVPHNESEADTTKESQADEFSDEDLEETIPTEASQLNEAEALTGTGGEDLELYEAAENTSFSPFKATSPSVAPIENGRYTSYFGYRINPITDEFSFHTGLDIAAEEGTKIRAVYSGRVLKTGEDSRAGKYIFLEHSGGFVTFYCHCSEISARVGANIRQGETIARVGSTGWSTGPHLHFEVRKDNVRYNPLYILDYDSYC